MVSNKLIRIIIIIAIILFAVLKFYSSYNKNNADGKEFNRNIDHLIFTTHAKCRMDCRHITENEIKEILHYGNINYNKSNLNNKRGATYALEGYSHEHQHLRIILAPKQNELVVVTCIDLDKEWQCDCN
ncbi:MAG: DUF4258 domain-containing protein [Bacteroidota bacterium]|nr:DUF4258 domain-containing protein [Bacteroidota bacterium]